MTKYITITKNGITAFLLIFILVFAFAGLTHAESNGNNNDNNEDNNKEDENVQEPAQKYGITFPIAELGGCSSLAACRQYCEDSESLTACIDFAKKKRFYKQSKSQSEIMTLAKAELGCDSADSCRTFCGEQENWVKCGEFAKKHQLSKPKKAEASPNPEILAKAKEILGCSTYEQCKTFCSQVENHQKCGDFAKVVGLKGGEEKKGPQGQPAYMNVSEKARFCKEHPDRCPKSSNPATSSSNICQKPTEGCGQYHYFDTTKCSCRSYEDYCQAKGCNWTGTTCQCTTTLSPTSPQSIGTHSSVKGISTVRGILQHILDWLK